MRYVETLIKKDIWDTQTGLVWRRDPEPGAYTFDKALARASQVAEKTRQPWRVPTVAELFTLVDHSKSSPASTFPGMPDWGFWSSSPYVGSANVAWNVYFDNGDVGYDLRYDTYAVRLVRNADGPSNLVQL